MAGFSPPRSWFAPHHRPGAQLWPHNLQAEIDWFPYLKRGDAKERGAVGGEPAAGGRHRTDTVPVTPHKEARRRRGEPRSHTGPGTPLPCQATRPPRTNLPGEGWSRSLTLQRMDMKKHGAARCDPPCQATKQPRSSCRERGGRGACRGEERKQRYRARHFLPRSLARALNRGTFLKAPQKCLQEATPRAPFSFSLSYIYNGCFLDFRHIALHRWWWCLVDTVDKSE
jgi:hypothetical protein